MAHATDRSCIRIECPDSRIDSVSLFDTASQGLKPGLQGLLQPGCSEAGMKFMGAAQISSGWMGR